MPVAVADFVYAEHAGILSFGARTFDTLSGFAGSLSFLFEYRFTCSLVSACEPSKGTIARRHFLRRLIARKNHISESLQATILNCAMSWGATMRSRASCRRFRMRFSITGNGSIREGRGSGEYPVGLSGWFICMRRLALDRSWQQRVTDTTNGMSLTSAHHGTRNCIDKCRVGPTGYSSPKPLSLGQLLNTSRGSVGEFPGRIARSMAATVLCDVEPCKK